MQAQLVHSAAVRYRLFAVYTQVNIHLHTLVFDNACNQCMNTNCLGHA